MNVRELLHFYTFVFTSITLSMIFSISRCRHTPQFYCTYLTIVIWIYLTFPRLHHICFDGTPWSGQLPLLCNCHSDSRFAPLEWSQFLKIHIKIYHGSSWFCSWIWTRKKLLSCFLCTVPSVLRFDGRTQRLHLF